MSARGALRLKDTYLKGLGRQDAGGSTKSRILRFGRTTFSGMSLDHEAKENAIDEERADSLEEHDQSALGGHHSQVTLWTTAILLLLVITLNIRLWHSGGGTQPYVSPSNHGSAYLDGFKIHKDEKGHYIQCPTNSSQTARQNPKCHYDVMIYGWLPSPCFEASMYATVANNTDWGFYHDRNGTRPIPQKTLMLGNYELIAEAFVSNEEHWQHCRYLHNTSIVFRERVPAMALDVHLDPHHMGHCLEFISDRSVVRSWEVTRTKAKFDVKRRCYVLSPPPG